MAGGQDIVILFIFLRNRLIELFKLLLLDIRCVIVFHIRLRVVEDGVELETVHVSDEKTREDYGQRAYMCYERLDSTMRGTHISKERAHVVIGSPQQVGTKHRG